MQHRNPDDAFKAAIAGSVLSADPSSRSRRSGIIATECVSLRARVAALEAELKLAQEYIEK